MTNTGSTQALPLTSMEALQARVTAERVVGKHADNAAVIRTENSVNNIESAVEYSLIDAIAEWKAD